MSNNFIECLRAIAPILILMAVGYFSKRAGIIAKQDVEKMNRVIFRVFMPVLMFENIRGSKLEESFNLELIAYTVIMTLVFFALSCLFAIKKYKNKDIRASVAQGLFRSNFVVGLSQILCKHCWAVQNRAKIFQGGSGASCCRLVYKITAV